MVTKALDTVRRPNFPDPEKASGTVGPQCGWKIAALVGRWNRRAGEFHSDSARRIRITFRWRRHRSIIRLFPLAP